MHLNLYSFADILYTALKIRYSFAACGVSVGLYNQWMLSQLHENNCMLKNFENFSGTRVLELSITMHDNYTKIDESGLINKPIHFTVFIDISTSRNSTSETDLVYAECSIRVFR